MQAVLTLPGQMWDIKLHRTDTARVFIVESRTNSLKSECHNLGLTVVSN